MASPTPPHDPTLAAADEALARVENSKPRRGYLGMSSIGRSCKRRLWYDHRWITRIQFDAATLKRFLDGHAGEDLQAQRLRMVDGITLLTVDPNTGRQFGYSDHDAHFRGHMDGAILGLLQAPKTWHVWEHKSTDEKKQTKLAKLKEDLGEKQALAAWDEVYYAQAVLYMHYSGMERHYLTCSTPGGRSTISVRTDANPTYAAQLITKAGDIIQAARPPERISDRPDWWECRFCDHRAVCHGGEMPSERHCRSCIHASPVSDGRWHCALHDASLVQSEQEEGCKAHRFIPDLIPGQQIDAAEDGSWIAYRLRDGSEWRDG